MPVLNAVSGSGEHPGLILTPEMLQSLRETLDEPLSEGWEEQLQEIVSHHLDWLWARFKTPTDDMHKVYRKAREHVLEARAALNLINLPGQDAKTYVKIGYDTSRRRKSDPSFASLPYVLSSIAGDLGRADDWLTEHETPSKRGVQPDERIDRLIWRLADFFEAHGLSASVTYKPEHEAYDSPFIRFAQRLNELLPNEARAPVGWASKAMVSQMRRVVRKRNEAKKGRAPDPKAE